MFAFIPHLFLIVGVIGIILPPLAKVVLLEENCVNAPGGWDGPGIHEHGEAGADAARRFETRGVPHHPEKSALTSDARGRGSAAR